MTAPIHLVHPDYWPGGNMLTVYKYAVPLADTFTLMLPKKAKILTVQAQEGFREPMLWALVDPSPKKELVERKFRLAGTGHPISELAGELSYIATFQMEDGKLVFHLFEIIEV